MRSRLAAVGVLVAVVLSAAACGTEGGSTMPTPAATPSSSASKPSSSSPQPSSPVPTPSSVAPRGGGERTLSPIPPPTLPPPKVGPSEPSDYIRGDVIAGRVVKGGSGPCYAVVNDDNRRFALHSAAGLTLEEGTYIRAVVAPLRAKIDCGAGTPYALVSFTRL